MVEEFPSLEELGNTITDNSSFPTNFDLNGFPPVTETPPPGYMSEEGDTQDQGDILGKSLFYVVNCDTYIVCRICFETFYISCGEENLSEFVRGLPHE